MTDTTILPRLNRLKSVLAETGHTGRWLSEQLGRDPATVSKWCTNSVQPDVQTLHRIAALLDVDVRILLTSTKL